MNVVEARPDGVGVAKPFEVSQQLELRTRGFDRQNVGIERLYGLGEISQEQLEAADPTYGCEGLCARPETTTRCACARCLGTKACDARCNDLPSCVVWRPTPDGGSKAVMSEAVGALCQGTWYRTMAACASGCAAKASCRSFSVSCDKRCQ